MAKSWRDIARPIIARVLQETQGQDEKAVRKALRKAYPWFTRSMHPYKIWCDEVKLQLGKRTFGAKRFPDERNPDQTSLF